MRRNPDLVAFFDAFHVSQPGRAGLGAQAGEARLAEVLRAAGFGDVRRAAETPLNLVLEARLP